MKYICLIALLAALTIISCNKTPTTTSSVESILKAGNWHLSSGTLTMRLPSGKDTVLNYINAIVPTCHKDDYIRFYSGVGGAVYAGSKKCSAADPDSVGFNWELINNNSAINIYNSQSFYYSVIESIQPFVYDTISHSPLVLDSISYGKGPTKITVVDSIYYLSFAEIPPAPTPPSTSLVDIDGATITNISQSSFTLNFSTPGSYPDSTSRHEMYPNTKSDIYHYSLTYTTF